MLIISSSLGESADTHTPSRKETVSHDNELQNRRPQDLQSTKNQPLKSVRQLFQTTERLIKDQAEITGLTTIDWKQPMWKETTLLCDRAVQIVNSKAYVFSDAVLCLGSLGDKPVEAWKNKNQMVFGKSLSQRSESN